MKRLGLVLIWMIAVNAAIAQEWEQVEAPTLQNLISVSFVDTQHGWIAADSGVVLRTTDGGQTWDSVSAIDTIRASEICFVSESLGWLSGSGMVYKSTDGGFTWSTTGMGGWDECFAMQFIDSVHGWATIARIEEFGSGRYFDTFLVRTTDGGQWWIPSWHELSHEDDRTVPTLIDFGDTRLGWVYFDFNDGAMHSTDGGIHWDWQWTYWWETILDLEIIDSLTWWLCVSGIDIGIISTTDGGASWTEHDVFPSAQRVKFANRQVGCLLIPQTAAVTTDAGTSWSVETTGMSWIGRDMTVLADGAVWLVGDSGRMAHRLPTLSSPEPKPQNLPEALALTAFPNPFNPATQLEFELLQAERVRLDVYSLTGQLVRTLADEVLPAGKHTRYLDGMELTSGVYLVRLDAGQQRVVQKVVLLR